jgi:hypothetical protein
VSPRSNSTSAAVTGVPNARATTCDGSRGKRGAEERGEPLHVESNSRAATGVCASVALPKVRNARTPRSIEHYRVGEHLALIWQDKVQSARFSMAAKSALRQVIRLCWP